MSAGSKMDRNKNCCYKGVRLERAIQMEERKEEDFIPLPPVEDSGSDSDKENVEPSKSVEQEKPVKQKRQLSARQLESLMKGRERLKQKHETMKKQRIEGVVESYLEQKMKESKKKKSIKQLRSPSLSPVQSEDEQDTQRIPAPPKLERQNADIQSSSWRDYIKPKTAPTQHTATSLGFV